jgi:sigma-E factor negative regulatory protein RseB
LISSRVALALACLLSSGLVCAQEAITWLTRMSEALKRLDYVGELVYSHAGQLETLRIYHAGDVDGGRERLISLSGDLREVIRAEGRVTCIGTGSRPATYSDDLGPMGQTSQWAALDPQQLQQHYALRLGESGRIAEHEARMVELKPLDAYRYGYRLWLEQQSGMLLKSVRFGADGRPVEQLMFSRLELGRRPSDVELGVGKVAPAPNAPVRPELAVLNSSSTITSAPL